ncbi:MAG: agmatinase [Phycisphaerae bacterium]
MTPPPTFLDLPPDLADPQRARYVVLPVPYEGAVSYARGTAAGPAAILAASAQVELYDEELGAECVAAGVATLPPVEPADDPAAMMDRVRAAAGPLMREGTFVLALGGEHSITAPLVAAAREAFGDLSVLHVDAHADLRDAYGGTPHSHACVMRRVLEVTPHLVQVGIRSLSKEEVEACPEQVARFITPAMCDDDPNWTDRVLGGLGPRVYVTVDMDGLDPSVAPGVGTPEPGGLSWRQVLRLLRRVAAEREVVAADVVETCPIPGQPLTEFVAARLAYKIIAYTQA